MTSIFVRFVCISALVFGFCLAANAQSRPEQASTAGKVVAGTGKAAVVVVGSAAKATWVTTSFAAKHVAKPVLKTVLVKAAPSVGKYVLKKSAKHLLPVAIKLAVL